jgi:hypothetical protein
VKVMKRPQVASLAPAVSKSADVPVEYQSLHKYLDGRYADTVVLRFAEIEDLLGSSLPDLARLREDWWANAEVDDPASMQSRTWIRASRTARANLSAKTVVFERVVG